MRSKNYLEVYSYIQATFIFHVSFFYYFWHSLMFGLCWHFWGLLWIFFGVGWGSKAGLRSHYKYLKFNCSRFPSKLTFIFHLILESSGLFWVKKGIFGVRSRFGNCYGVYSWILTTFVFYLWLNSDAIVQFHFFLRRDGRTNLLIEAPTTELKN